MKVLLVNGSPRANSNTLLGLHEMEKIFQAQGIKIFAAVLPAADAVSWAIVFSKMQ